MPRVPALLTAFALVVTLAACGSEETADDPTVAAPSASPSEAASSEPTEVECEEVSATEEPAADATTDLSVKPQPQLDDGAPPCDLVITDIVVGAGAEAVAGVQADVKYVGVLYDGGTEFDASWNRGPEETLPVPLGQGGVIPGFEQGITGMREGGRRQVVIPGDLAYGPTGRPPIPPNAALVFVIDLVQVTPAP